MDVEVSQVARFLAEHEPWASLPDGVLAALVPRLRMRYFRRGTVILPEGRPNDTVLVIRSGVVDITSGGQLVERADVGTAIGSSSTTSRGPSAFGLVAVEDTLALVVEGDLFRGLLTDHDSFAAFFDRNTQRRMARAVAEQQHSRDPSSSALNARVADLGNRREPVTIAADVSVREAAQMMTEREVSALLVTADERLVGIVTDRDLRAKVIAAGLDPHSPVAAIMTRDPISVPPDTRAFEAMLQMTSRRIHHLPVTDDGRAVGMVSTGDLVRLERAHPVHLAQDIARQDDVAGVAEVAARVPGLVSGYVQQGASAAEIGRVLTAVADAVTTRLLVLVGREVRERHGPEPAAWCWLVLGSQARHETGLSSDQDHALVLDDGADGGPGGGSEGAGGAWFTDLANGMERALAQCGYQPCPGEMMASNPRWRLTVAQWRRQFLTWLDTPTPEALFHAGTFFDARPLVSSVTDDIKKGEASRQDASLFEPLRRLVQATAPDRPRFLTHLAGHAVQRQPPLGFLGTFVVERQGDQSASLDLKAGGSHAIIELARVHALASGVGEVSTDRRLAEVAARGAISTTEATELRDAFEFITQVRLRHQADQVTAGLAPTNRVDPQALSRADRRHLRDAFGIIRQAQAGLAQRHGTSLVT